MILSVQSARWSSNSRSIINLSTKTIFVLFIRTSIFNCRDPSFVFSPSILKNKKQNVCELYYNLSDMNCCWSTFQNSNVVACQPKFIWFYLKCNYVKLWFTNKYFVGFYSVPNLIVIIFNFLYSVFIVGFDCKGCVLERVCVKTPAIEVRRVLAGISQLSFPWSEVCVLHMIGMRKVSIGWRQLCLASISRVKPSHETPARHSVLLVCTIWYTFFVPTLYILIFPTYVEECFWEKTLVKHLES